MWFLNAFALLIPILTFSACLASPSFVRICISYAFNRAFMPSLLLSSRYFQIVARFSGLQYLVSGNEESEYNKLNQQQFCMRTRKDKTLKECCKSLNSSKQTNVFQRLWSSTKNVHQPAKKSTVEQIKCALNHKCSTRYLNPVKNAEATAGIRKRTKVPVFLKESPTLQQCPSSGVNMAQQTTGYAIPSKLKANKKKDLGESNLGSSGSPQSSSKVGKRDDTKPKSGSGKAEECWGLRQPSIELEPNPETKIHFDSHHAKIDLAISQSSPDLKPQILNHKNLSLKSVLDLAIESVQHQKEQREKEKLRLEMEQYKKQCRVLEAELRQTLNTVKIITNQLELANKERGDIEGCTKESSCFSRIPRSGEESSHSFEVSQGEQARNQAQISGENGAQLTIVEDWANKEETGGTRGRVIQTISPLIITSNSPRLIRLGRDRGYCRVCGNSGRCLCLG